MKHKTLRLAALAGLLAGLASGVAFAGDDLGAAATNPVSNLVQFRLQDGYSPSNRNADGYSNALFAQAVVPFPSLASKFDSLQGIVVRATTAYVSTPDLDVVGRKQGLGDTNILAFAVPKRAPRNTVWGIGPALTIPTAGDNEYTGSGQWQAGPAFVFLNTPAPGWQVGSLLYHQWDYASTRSDAADINQSFFQPILFKHFDKGWYVGLPDTPQKYDHKSSNWTTALGAQLGRVVKMGKQPMQFFGEAYYNSEDNDVPEAEWTIKFQVGWLFPQ